MPPALQNPITLWLLLTAALAGLVYAFMRPELRWKAIVYGSFLLACGVAIWPPYERDGVPGKIHLGLDLRGGIHLVLQVVVDDALNATVDDAVNTARDQATRKGIQVGAVQRVSPTSFSVEGIEPARVKDMRDLLRDFFRNGWEVRDAGEGKFTVEMTDLYERQLKEQTVQEAIRTLERRVNALGVAEPVIAATGQPRRPDPRAAPGRHRRRAGQARHQDDRPALAQARRELRGHARRRSSRASGARCRTTWRWSAGPSDTPGQPTYYLLRKEAHDHRPRPQERARRGRRDEPAADQLLAQRHRHRQVLPRDRAATSAASSRSCSTARSTRRPVIQSKLGSDNRITGRFTTQEADELSKILKAGALPATLKYLQELTVGASLGRDSIRDGVRASIAAMAFITIFMLVYYRLAGPQRDRGPRRQPPDRARGHGLHGATLTLPGIAGIILTVGVGVDTNVLVFERIREELRNGKTVRAAVAERLRAGLDHDPRHPRDRAHRRRLPLPVRHRARSRASRSRS